MLDKFKDIVLTFQDIERQISDPEIIADHKRYQSLLKKHAELKEVVSTYETYLDTEKQLSDTQELLSDPEMAEMAKEESALLKEKLNTLKQDLQLSLIPKDPNDDKNAIVEIRSGTGGEEAALFAEDLYRMYVRHAEKTGWKVEILSQHATGIGGLKEVIFLISGSKVFGRLKHEMGVHRVQRVPKTEASGRIHTSAASVAIMPEAEDVDIEINPKDLRIDTFRASGAGGQHVNKTSSAIRITHIPTNTVVACQDERSQFQNKDKAMRVLKAKLYDQQVEAQRSTEAELRKSQVGSGDRSEKIRTYNFPQSRITDHRINFTVHALDDVLNGDLDPILDELGKADQLEKLKSVT